MNEDCGSSYTTRRGLLRLLVLGAAGAMLGAAAISNKVFAKQFLAEGAKIRLPEMVYDPSLQMMVDPKTGRPIYADAGKSLVALPTVTAGCDDCPKCDDQCDETE